MENQTQQPVWTPDQIAERQQRAAAVLNAFTRKLEESTKNASCFKTVDAAVRLPNGAILRCYQSFPMGQPPVFVLQRIVNPGVTDKRLKEWKRERREELCRVASVEEVVEAAKVMLDRLYFY